MFLHTAQPMERVLLNSKLHRLNVTQVEIDFPSVDIFEDKKHIKSKSSTIIDFSANDYKIVRQGEGQFPK